MYSRSQYAEHMSNKCKSIYYYSSERETDRGGKRQRRKIIFELKTCVALHLKFIYCDKAEIRCPSDCAIA